MEAARGGVRGGGASGRQSVWCVVAGRGIYGNDVRGGSGWREYCNGGNVGGYGSVGRVR